MSGQPDRAKEFRASLVELAARHGITPTDPQLAALDIHRGLLLSWGARMNLTAIRDPEEIVRRHFLEGILAGDILRRRNAAPPLLDLGSGNGFPAVPAAVMAGDLRSLILVESSGKKAAFLRALVRELGWSEARVVVRRVEKGEDLADLPCATFLTRGVRPFGLLEEGLPFLRPGGTCLLFFRRASLESQVPTLLAHFEIQDEVALEGRDSGILILSKTR